MYSRYQNRRDPSVRLPENYSGCAFSENKTTDVPRFLEVATPSQEETHRPPPPPPPPPKPEKSPPVHLPSLLPVTKKGFSFLNNGLEFDQLLLLGLILLLSRGEEGNDIVLYLALLLLCG